MRYARVLAVALATVLGMSGAPVFAGQVRITVMTDQFVPRSIQINQGDQVVWVWANSNHSVTQGSSCVVSNPIFNTGVLNMAGRAFTWKSDRTGSVRYFCLMKCSSGMTGTLTIGTGGVNVADFRITEVVHGPPDIPHTGDFIEITNMGMAQGNLGFYRISVSAGVSTDISLQDVVVAPGGRVIVHMGASGSSTATDIFMWPALPPTGSVALFTPDRLAPADLDANLLVDFVQWGAAAQANESIATTAGIWGGGEFAPNAPAEHAIEFCGTAADRGASFWHEISVPNPAANGNCQTPTQIVTWGDIKARLR